MTENEILPSDPETAEINYTEDNIVTLSWNDHIRERPGMYIDRKSVV